MWRVIFALFFALLLLPGIALGEPPEMNRRDRNNTNTVEKFKLEEDDFYRGEYGTLYSFLSVGSDEWYGWWKRYNGSKTLKSYLYFSRKGFGGVRIPIPE